MRRLIWALPLWLAASLAFGQAATVEVVEFYHEELDHYFITADPVEIRNLDTGVAKGWARTNQKFVAGGASAELPGASGVCRFYGKPERGLDSHFYPANLAECVTTREKYHPHTWVFESESVFKLYLPDQNTGVCPATTVPVYRAYNNRADVNHRYTTERSVHLSMLAKGYVEEGFGGNGKPVVAMCALSASNPVAAGVPVPECTLAADNAFPRIGGSVTLTATCTNSPTKFTWSESACAAASGNTCAVTSPDVGYKNYTVKGGNAGGDGVAVGVLVQWQPVSVAPPPPPPVAQTAPTCTIQSSTLTPVINNDLVLDARCTGSPTSYAWQGCPTASGAGCRTRETSPVVRTYTVTATNNFGTSVPTSMTANWVTTPPPVGVNCTLFANPVSPAVGGAVTLTATCTGTPTTYTWTNCSSNNQPVCTPTPLTSEGAQQYLLTATNASGSSHTASVIVTWQNAPPPLPPPTGGVTVVDFKQTRFRTMDGLYLSTPILAIRFRTPATPGATGLLAATEYIGEARSRDSWLSTTPGGSAIAGSTSGPATTIQTRVAIGIDIPGHLKLDVGQKLYYNVRGSSWQPEDAREQFSVFIGLP